MKTTTLWASIALSAIPAALAQATGTSAAGTTATAAAPSCTASLITTLCDYPEPGVAFAVAEDTPGCWAYCNDHPPCNFAIFARGNPYTDSGTCWLYPGQSFDASAGKATGCNDPYLSVYAKPVCAAATPTSTEGACAATASPSAVASVCGYAPPGDCFTTCTASLGAVDCLSQCAKAASCSYVVFNTHNPDNSPYASGTCWMYSNGTFDAAATTPCSGKPDQYVYNNLCPKPTPTSSPVQSATGSSSKPSGTASVSGTGSGSGSGSSSGTGTASAAEASTTVSKNAAPATLSVASPLAVGVVAAMMLWRGL